MRSHVLALGFAGIVAVLEIGCTTPPKPPPPTPAPAGVRVGIDNLIANNFAPLRGRRVGLITNPTGVTHDLRPTADVLHAALGDQLVALFAPEHGIRGAAYAGAHIDDERDPQTGLPVYSLHGKTRKATPEMLAEIDTLVFDVQDIGARSYTYISTLALAMEAAAEHGVRVVVLDRPNPLGGERIEGRPLDLKFQSFVGHLPVPYLHGMTVGELARMINGEKWLPGGRQCDLVVVPMTGWQRAMRFDQSGLTWVMTSPHVPRADSALFYAATGIMGELHVLSEGVGYTLPFELIGGPDVDGNALAMDLNGRGLAGVHFRPIYFTPFYGQFAKQPCAGVQVHLLEPERVRLTDIQFLAMDSVRRQKPDLALFGNKRDEMFDKVCGTDEIRRLIETGRPIDEVLAAWHAGEQEFHVRRAPYLLYPGEPGE